VSGQENAIPMPMRKILVVEDDANYRRIVTLQLQAAGHTCLTASTHSEAIRLLKEHPGIEVILLDYAMYGSSPDALVEQINQLQRQLRLIGHSSLNRAREFSALGIHEFLQKPLDLCRFVNSLAEEVVETAQPPPSPRVVNLVPLSMLSPGDHPYHKLDELLRLVCNQRPSPISPRYTMRIRRVRARRSTGVSGPPPGASEIWSHKHAFAGGYSLVARLRSCR
jgi:CheY-like chemotaxis protein